MYEQAGFLRNSSPVSEDRNFSLGGRSCGNPCFSDGVAMGAGQHRGETGTSEPDLARTSCHCLGQIAMQVPVSYLARTCLQSLV